MQPEDDYVSKIQETTTGTKVPQIWSLNYHIPFSTFYSYLQQLRLTKIVGSKHKENSVRSRPCPRAVVYVLHLSPILKHCHQTFTQSTKLLNHNTPSHQLERICPLAQIHHCITLKFSFDFVDRNLQLELFHHVLVNALTEILHSTLGG